MDTVTMLALLTGLLLIALIVPGIMNRVLLRLSLRNTLRRPGQTLLLLSGLALAAALITASYGLTDSLNDTARLAQVEQVGNLDESVLGNFKQPQLDRSLAAIRANPNVQAATALVQSASVATITSPRTGFTSSGVGIVPVPPDFDHVFGGVTDRDGKTMTLANLPAGQVDVSTTLAESFDVQPGDRLTVSLFGQQFTATVRSILAIDIATSDFDSGSQPELVLSFSFYQHLTGSTGSASTIVVKNSGQGGMNDTGPKNSRSQAVAQFLRQLFGIQKRQPGSSESYTAAHGSGTHLTIIKPDLVAAADSSSFFAGLSPEDYKQFSQLLPALTLLLVGAGLLFLALQFILLATERRAELGMSRAIGMQRTHIILAWLIEGACYAVVAGGLGLMVGSGMVALEIDALAQLHAHTLQGTPLILPFHVWISGQSLLSAFCLSVLLACSVALLTALWISRSNIVAAIGNLHDPPVPRISLKDAFRRHRCRWRACAPHPFG